MSVVDCPVEEKNLYNLNKFSNVLDDWMERDHLKIPRPNIETATKNSRSTEQHYYINEAYDADNPYSEDLHQQHLESRGSLDSRLMFRCVLQRNLPRTALIITSHCVNTRNA